MNIQLLFIVSCFVFFSCDNGNNTHDLKKYEKDIKSDSQGLATTLDFNAEVEKWKTELYLNREVGPPCEEDYNKWAEDNPDFYWGMQEIKSFEHDWNSDGIKDGFFYFAADNCVGGNGVGPNFSMLVYSHKNQTLTNKNVTRNILEYLESMFDNNVEINIYYNSLTKANTIKGNYSIWMAEDAHCCPSIKGIFEYNPIDFSTTLQ